jgi:FlaA1/EpsC-like NDP-sugar epimerase
MRINWRVLIVLGFDAVAVIVAWLCAYYLRFGGSDMVDRLRFDADILRVAIPVQVAVIAALGLYRSLWRYVNLQDLKVLLLAVVLSTITVPVVQALVSPGWPLPRTALLLFPILLTLLMGGGRLAYRMWRESLEAGSTAFHGKPVIVIGAGHAGLRLLQQLQRSEKWRPVALLDDSAAKQRRRVHGVAVAGRSVDLPEVAARLGVRHAIIAMPSARHGERKRIVEICRAVHVDVFTLPSVDEVMREGEAFERIRKIDIEDLLGRDPVQLDDRELGAHLTGKVVMVTGAGGSIGSELCRQIARFSPHTLVAFEQGEFSLYQLTEEFAVRKPELNVVAAIGDICDRARVDQVIESWRPSIIFHAAAYKHVPLMESANAWEAVRNNVGGTLTVASSAVDHGVASFVQVSTDKAVNPTNVMGATKRLAEICCEALQQQGRTRFGIVRFGNVLGSAGSVIPKFQAQIARGGPITVTHPDIIRYFMSIPEAAQLVLQAGTMGRGGEIFVMDMGEPVKIVDVARDMIRLSGYEHDDIGIEFTGLRPGEKLYEELLADGETTQSTPHPKLRIARNRPVDSELFSRVVALLATQRPLSDDEVRAQLGLLVPEYERPDARKRADVVDLRQAALRSSASH